MYAVIKTGGKQYKVSAGEKLRVEHLAVDVGAEVVIDQVLAVGTGEQFAVGAPLLTGATVSATVMSHGLGEKVRIFKMRRRKHYQKHQGHRQQYTELFIGRIASELGSTSAEVPAIPAAPDDLERIEGIGPKIDQLMAKAGIRTFAQLAATPVEKLREILHAGGPRFAAHDPGTWPEQAALAAKGEWDAFRRLTDELIAGKRK
jgi:large subunit ribosomal protein L21